MTWNERAALLYAQLSYPRPRAGVKQYVSTRLLGEKWLADLPELYEEQVAGRFQSVGAFFGHFRDIFLVTADLKSFRPYDAPDYAASFKEFLLWEAQRLHYAGNIDAGFIEERLSPLKHLWTCFLELWGSSERFVRLVSTRQSRSELEEDFYAVLASSYTLRRIRAEMRMGQLTLDEAFVELEAWIDDNWDEAPVGRWKTLVSELLLVGAELSPAEQPVVERLQKQFKKGFLETAAVFFANYGGAVETEADLAGQMKI